MTERAGQLTDDARYDALVTRDRRFDGVFFVAVSTTGIYCRPICPARTPARSRCAFYATPVEAEAAGYRACLRCRPELAPGNLYADVDAAGPGRVRARREPTASVDTIDELAAMAIARIAEGALNGASVDDLAAELGVSARHLRRAVEARLGVAPVALAQSRRLALVKQLLQDTRMPMTDIAFAAGYRSVRRFNAAFSSTFGKPPSLVRRESAPMTLAAPLVLRLDYREPFDWRRLLAFLAARAVPGVERVEDDRYRRIVHLHGATGTIEVARDPDRPSLRLAASRGLVGVLMPLVARVRRLFDLDARPDVIARVLGRDRLLAPLVSARPGLRVPGAVDGFEAAVRALLGQQVSVAAATTLAGRFAATFGTAFDGGPALATRFPTAREVAKRRIEEIAAIGLPRARAAAVHALAAAVAAGTLRLDGVVDLPRFVERAVALPGVGPWTAHYLAMRALHLPDAFPAADLGIQKALARTVPNGGSLSPRAAEARAERWRPFRAYAVIQLWTAPGERDDDDDRTDKDARHARDRVAARPDRSVRGGRRAGRAGPARGAVAPADARDRDRARDARARARGRAARRVLRRHTP